RHLGHFVEKQHAARGELNLPGLGLLRASEGAALEAEQLRFEQLFRQRRAVDRDEGAASPRRLLVDESGDDFLAGARLAEQAGRGFSGRDLTGPFQHRAPEWAGADRCDVRRRLLLPDGPRARAPITHVCFSVGILANAVENVVCELRLHTKLLHRILSMDSEGVDWCWKP